jgi:hypothetical protein
MRRAALIALLGIGTIAGFGSGFASVARHRRAHAEGCGWRGEAYSQRFRPGPWAGPAALATPAAPVAAPTVSAPAAPVTVTTPAAPVTVTTPGGAGAPGPVIFNNAGAPAAPAPTVIIIGSAPWAGAPQGVAVQPGAHVAAAPPAP